MIGRVPAEPTLPARSAFVRPYVLPANRLVVHLDGEELGTIRSRVRGGARPADLAREYGLSVLQILDINSVTDDHFEVTLR